VDIFLSKLALLNDEKETPNIFQRQIDEKLAAKISLKKTGLLTAGWVFEKPTFLMNSL